MFKNNEIKVMDLIPSFKESLINDDIIDVVKEVTELSIDSLLENEILRNIPIVNILFATYSVARNIRDYNLIKQTIAFITELNNGKIDQKAIDDHINYLNDTKQINKELSKVLIILDRNNDIEKSIILAKLYRAYIKKEIDWLKFCECVEVINQTIVQDLDYLVNIFSNNRSIVIESNTDYRINRIKSIGLIIGKSFEKAGIWNLPEAFNKEKIEISELGLILCNIITK